MDVVKFAEAIAWPLASTIIALVFLLITRMIVTKSGKIGFKISDWFSLEADTSKQIVEAATIPPIPISNDPSDSATAGGDLLITEDGSKALAPPVMNEVPLEEGQGSFTRLYTATTLSSLEEAFDKFLEEDDVRKEEDFWTSYYISRRKSLGARGTADELEKVSNANPTWIYPIIDLLKAAVEAHDTDRALQLIDQLLARRTSENAAHILTAVLHAYFVLYSPERAIQFYVEQSKNGLTSAQKSSLLTALAGNFAKNTDKFAHRVASEMAIIIDPGKKSEGFQLAFSYAEEEKSWSLSYNTYDEIGLESDYYAWALNNKGVLLQDLSKSASIEFYELGLRKGNAQAISNLAKMLIDDGYISAAERLLNDVADTGEAAEHIATTRAAALTARREMRKQLDEVKAFASAEAQRYRAVIGRAQRTLDAGVLLTSGMFVSDDGSFIVMLDKAGAAVRSVVGTICLEGVLPMSVMGFNGIIFTKGSGLSGSLSFVSIFATSQSGMTAVVWPPNKSLNERLRFVELRRRTNTESLGDGKGPPAILTMSQ